MKLIFNEFHLEPDRAPWNCPLQYLEILDGNDTSSKIAGRFCGFVYPGSVHSSGRYMWVRFRSDNLSSHYRRFEATFKAEDKTGMSRSLLIFPCNMHVLKDVQTIVTITIVFNK